MRVVLIKIPVEGDAEEVAHAPFDTDKHPSDHFSLEALQSIVGGLIDFCSAGIHGEMVVGVPRGLPLNHYASDLAGFSIFGDAGVITVER